MTDPSVAFEETESNLGPLIDAPKRGSKDKAKPVNVEPRTTIVLEDNEQIPPTGQFFGVQGVGYVLRPGEPAAVPDGLLNVLDTAIISVPVKDTSDVVIGYRDRLRFPYRVITERRKA